MKWSVVEEQRGMFDTSFLIKSVSALVCLGVGNGGIMILLFVCFLCFAYLKEENLVGCNLFEIVKKPNTNYNS